ncbi:MAG: helix-turn-helix domain-containing protein [Lentisphaerae bacterium]|nr:helix-turn-helix domain-containing protein [Lentisphaerota bacterium]
MKQFQFQELCKHSLPLVVQKRGTPFYQSIHCHDAIEIVYIAHGKGWCAIDSIIHPMLSGDLYIIPVGSSHEYYGESGLCYFNVIFNEAIFLPEAGELYYQLNLPHEQRALPVKCTFAPDVCDQILHLLEELNDELASTRRYALLRSRALFVDFIILLLRNASRSTVMQTAKYRKGLGKVLFFIAENLNKKIVLGELAAIAGYSPEYLGQLFAREIGSTLTDYISTRRLERACNMLSDSSHTLEEIAASCGFFDASYLIKIFKKKLNITPAEFRRRTNQRHLEAEM